MLRSATGRDGSSSGAGRRPSRRENRTISDAATTACRREGATDDGLTGWMDGWRSWRARPPARTAPQCSVQRQRAARLRPPKKGSKFGGAGGKSIFCSPSLPIAPCSRDSQCPLAALATHARLRLSSVARAQPLFFCSSASVRAGAHPPRSGSCAASTQTNIGPGCRLGIGYMQPPIGHKSGGVGPLPHPRRSNDGCRQQPMCLVGRGEPEGVDRHS